MKKVKNKIVYFYKIIKGENMKRKIFIILIFDIFLFVGLAVVFRLHQTNNNSSDGENEKTNLEIKREILLKKIEEMQREKAIEAYIEYGTTDDEVEILIEKVSIIDGVDSVTLRSKEEVLEDWKKRFDNNRILLKQYEGENNIFPDILIISVNDTSKIEKIVEKVSKFKNIEKVQSNKKTTNELLNKIDTLSEEDIDLVLDSID